MLDYDVIMCVLFHWLASYSWDAVER